MRAADTDRETASGDLRPHPPIRQPARPVPMGARTEALHRAQKRRRTDGARDWFPVYEVASAHMTNST